MRRRSRSRACPRSRVRPSFDADGLLRAVVGAELRLAAQRLVDLLLEHHAVAEIVRAEHLGCEHVTAAMPDTEVGVDANLHHLASVTPDLRAPHNASRRRTLRRRAQLRENEITTQPL